MRPRQAAAAGGGGAVSYELFVDRDEAGESATVSILDLERRIGRLEKDVGVSATASELPERQRSLSEGLARLESLARILQESKAEYLQVKARSLNAELDQILRKRRDLADSCVGVGCDAPPLVLPLSGCCPGNRFVCQRLERPIRRRQGLGGVPRGGALERHC